MFIDVLSHRPSARRRFVRSMWHRGARPRWRTARPFVLGALALVVVSFGYVGFNEAASESHFDSVYRAVQLFTFGGNVGSRPNTWLEIARFLGPLVVGYAALAAILSLYREQLQRGRLRLLRDHVVIAGAGAAGFRMAKAFEDQDWQVVVVDRDPTNPALEGCRERGIDVITADATDAHILRRVGVRRAILLVVACGDDGVNVDVAQAARVVARGRKRGVLTALVVLDDFELWRIMRAQALLDRDVSPFRLELFNVFATAAEMLLDEYKPFTSGFPLSPHVLMIGSAGVGVGASLIAETIRRWAESGAPSDQTLRLTIAGPLADHDRTRLLALRPELEKVQGVRLDAWKADLTAERLKDLPATVSAVYVTLLSETAALRVAFMLREQPELPGVPIVVAVADEKAGVGAALRKGGSALRNVHAFGVLGQSLTPNALGHTVTERIARLTHEMHVAEATANGIDPNDSSLTDWGDLEGSLRESNRLFADGIAANLERVGCTVFSASELDPQAPFSFTDDEIAELAPLEHQRWERSMTRIGYRPGPTKDHKRKRHPMIGVEWAQLLEENKQKDRAHVRSIPRTLARAGFVVRRVDRADQVGMASAASAGNERLVSG